MIKVTATIKIEFEVQENDPEIIKEALYEAIGLNVEEDELMDSTKLKLVDLEEESEDPEFEDEED